MALFRRKCVLESAEKILTDFFREVDEVIRAAATDCESVVEKGEGVGDD
jgi:hypothetical protein